MSNNNLDSPNWGDEPSPWSDDQSAPAAEAFGSAMPNIFQSEEFAPPSYDDEEEEEEELAEEEPIHSYKSKPVPETNDVCLNEIHDTGFGDYNDMSNTSHPKTSDNILSETYDNSSSIRVPKSANVLSEAETNRNTSLLNSLTDDIATQDPFSSSLPTSDIKVNKSESLFQNLSEDTKFKNFSANSSNIFSSVDDSISVDNARKASQPESPVKIFKAPRIRRNKLVQKSGKNIKLNLNDSLPIDENKEVDLKKKIDQLGPLGSSLEKVLKLEEATTLEEKQKTSVEKLVEHSNGRLYPISSNHKKLTENPELTSQIGQFFKQKNQEKLAKKLPKRPETHEKIEQLIIEVGDPIKVGDITSAHIVYSVRSTFPVDSEIFKKIKVSNNESQESEETLVVTRRYKDFRWLYHQLQSNNPGYIVPPPPSKQAVGRFNEQFIETRRFALEKMLTKIASNSVLQKDVDFLMFLNSSNFANDSKEREHITGSGASTANAEDDYDSFDISSDLKSASGSGFMSALGGAFSFTNRVVDQDEFFLNQKTYIENLDVELKSFHKSFELVVQQRNELSSIMGEFSGAITSLAEVDTSSASSSLINEFALVNTKIKELLERQSMQDLITLGSVLDEYIRLLGSIRAVFSQRYKALVALTNSEQELEKKQTYLAKFTRNRRNQIDKIEQLKKESEMFEKKNNHLKENYNKISTTIKSQLANFGYAKIDDFRISVETFLEGMIESQKEAIETWETFFTICNSS